MKVYIYHCGMGKVTDGPFDVEQAIETLKDLCGETAAPEAINGYIVVTINKDGVVCPLKALGGGFVTGQRIHSNPSYVYYPA